MNQGYVKLYRKSLASTVFGHEGLWKLFCLCLMRANHQEAEVVIPGLLKPIKLSPGQFITGRFSLWEDYHQLHLKKKPRRKPLPTGKTLFQWLLTLQSMSILCIKSYNKYSIITVLNWNQYQQNVQQTFNRRSTGVHEQECNKNDKDYISVDLYRFYLQEINPEQKTRQRAVSNISHHLKKFSPEDLRQSIQNYKSIAIDREPQYRKNPANFFGKREKYFIDFLVENFTLAQEPKSTGSALLDQHYGITN